MKRLLIVVALCLAIAGRGLAQETGPNAPATKQQVETYLNAIHSHDMMVSMIDAMAKPMHQMVHEQYLKQKDKLPPDFEERMNKLTDDLMKSMPLDQITQSLVPVYQKHFTRGDLDAVLAFYASPAGKKLLRETPAIMGESMRAMAPVIRQNMDAVNQKFQQQMIEMMKNSANPPAQ